MISFATDAIILVSDLHGLRILRDIAQINFNHDGSASME